MTSFIRYNEEYQSLIRDHPKSNSSGLVKWGAKHPGTITLIAISILALIALVSLYFSFGDFHKFGEWAAQHGDIIAVVISFVCLFGFIGYGVLKESGEEDSEKTDNYPVYGDL